MNLQDLIQTTDILRVIARYLPLEAKLLLGKTYEINLLTFYDFTSKEYELKELIHLFDKELLEDFHDFNDYLDYNAIFREYTNIHKRKYIESNLDYFDIARIQKVCNIPLEEFMIKLKYSHSEWHTKFEEECDEKLRYIINDSIIYVNIRVFIQIIEDSEIKIEYDKSSLVIPNALTSEVNKYYFQNILHMDAFCKRCGTFGHNSLSSICILYNEDYARKEIEKQAQEILNDILTKVEYIAEKRSKNVMICKGQMCNNSKSYRCHFSMCKHCCKSRECKYHVQKGS